MATARISGATRGMMTQGVETLRDHQRKYAPVEKSYFAEAGVSDRERSLADAVARGVTTGTTLNTLRAQANRPHGAPVGSSANIHRSNRAVNEAAQPLSLQAARQQSDLTNADRSEKIGALRYGQGQATAMSSQNNAAQSSLHQSAILAKQISDAQDERNKAAMYDMAGTALGEAGRMAYDHATGLKTGGLGEWLSNAGFNRPGTKEAADLYGQVRDRDGAFTGLTDEQANYMLRPTSGLNRFRNSF